METICLNIIPTEEKPTCHARQNDNERVIRARLYENELAYDIQSGDQITLDIQKPDGTNLSENLTASEGDTFVDISIKDTMTDLAGTNLCTLKITNGNSRIGTSLFYMSIEADPTTGGVTPEDKPHGGLKASGLTVTSSTYETL